MTDIRDYVTQHADRLYADLDAWLRIPSISADPAHAGDVRASAEWAAEALRRTGFPTVEVWETDDGGHPAVYAERLVGADKPTVVVYGHHDVQPVDPLELWESPPFEPTVRGDDLFARGAVDDKGQVLFHLLGLEAALASYGELGINLKVLVEGEEEVGSPHFAALLKRERERLRCDVVVVSDTGIFDKDTPSMCTGMRGLVYSQVDLFGPEVDLHSGSFGGAVPNPATEIARLCAALHDDDRHVTLPGFYDRVVPLSDRDRELMAALPFDEAAWLRDATSTATLGESGFTTLERVGARPTAEVNGIWGGYTGIGQKTIIPAEAHAKISFRLVADQVPAEVEESFRQWVAERVPAGLRHEVRFMGGVRPCLTPLDHPALQAATRAMERAFGGQILYTREGGSGPEADLAEVLEAPVVFLGVGLPDDRIHSPNEKVNLPNLLRGAEAAAYLWKELADADLGRP
ncbi:MAG TPA: dipeptidase [Mycobacteriales bacterium]|nr:dipeptidase [Mycobacteriales bacterium]